jgi:hypothetical protein
MTRNVTLKLDEHLLKKCRHAAVERNMSLSRWLAGAVSEILVRQDDFAAAKQRALSRLASAEHHLGGTPLSRDDAHAR